MLTPEQVDAIRDKVIQLSDPITEYLLSDIARRVSQAGQLTSTATYQIWRAQQLGLSQKEIAKQLQAILNVSNADIKKLLTQSAKVGYNFDISRLPVKSGIAFADNLVIQQTVSAAVKLARDDFTNLTRTLGMVDPYGQALPLQDVYRKTMDFAFEKVFTGATDYNTAIRQATANLAKYGVQTIDYKSGTHASLEAAVRRNIMSGIGQMANDISEYNHDSLGCNGWEISAHAACAPDHEPIQGKQYSDEEYKALNESLVREIGTLNCGHMASPIILGISKPQYSEKDLAELKAKNDSGVKYQGRHYSTYEATQQQRNLERSIRLQKRHALIANSTGDKEQLLSAQTRMTLLKQEYRRFSKTAKLPMQNEREQIAGFGRAA